MTRILVLDDELLIGLMVQDWLRELACETVGPANSAQQALLLIDKTPPDAAILDLMLGNETSYRVAAVLRSRRIPFAFATGYGDKGLDSSFKNEMIIAKPFDFEAIKAALAGLLNGGRAASISP